MFSFRLLLLTVTALVVVSAQDAPPPEVGVDICACQPAVYNITIRADLGCGDTSVMGPGILNTACLIETRLTDAVGVTDFVPATVSEIQIMELDVKQNVVGQSQFTDGPYFDGDVVQYTSIVRSMRDSINGTNLPLGFQVSVIGNNALNQPIVNTYGIIYDGNCGVFPLLEEGETIGWTEFVSHPNIYKDPLAHTIGTDLPWRSSLIGLSLGCHSVSYRGSY